MGHDDIYAKDAQELNEKLSDRAIDTVKDNMHDMNLDQLELLADISDNIDSFVTVFKVIAKK